MKHLQNVINYRKRMICFQKTARVAIFHVQETFILLTTNLCANNFFLPENASPCHREPLKGFQVVQCSIFPKFQLLHSAKWRQCLLVPTLNSSIQCFRQKQVSKSHLTKLQPNYSYSSTGIPVTRESREIKQPLSHTAQTVAALYTGMAKNFLHLIAKTDHEFVVNV